MVIKPDTRKLFTGRPKIFVTLNLARDLFPIVYLLMSTYKVNLRA